MSRKLVSSALLNNIADADCEFRQPRNLNNSLKALAIFIITSVLSTLACLQFKLYAWLTPSQVGLYGYSSALFMILPAFVNSTRFTPRKNLALKEGNRYCLLFTKSVAAVAFGILYYQALGRIPGSLVFVILSSTPLFALVLGRVVLKEKLSTIKIVAVALTIVGIVLTGFLDDTSLDVPGSLQLASGILLAVAASVTGAMSCVMLKQLCTLNMSSVCVAEGLVGTIVSIILLFSLERFVVPPCGLSAVVILLCATLETLGNVSYYYCLKFAEAGIAAAVLSGLDVLFSFTWEFLFFARRPQALEYGAALLVLFGTGLNSFERFIPCKIKLNL